MVLNTFDSGAGSLRDAITTARNGDAIQVRMIQRQ